MARLIVEAATAGLAAPGNRRPVYIIVSVTNENGVPVEGLAAANFDMRTLIVGPGGAQVEISLVFGGAQGLYRVEVLPRGTFTWVNGRYIFALLVKGGRTKGKP